MNEKYCLPIIKNKKSEVLEVVHLNMADYSYFEIWLDYIDDPDETFIKELIELLQEKLILLFRRQNLEKIKIELEKRLRIISLLENSESLIDLDVFDQKDELEHIKNAQLEVKTIVSYHDYEKMPESEKLKEILNIMNKYKPTIYKIATMCAKEIDALRLLQLLLELRTRNLKYIVLGMGESGMITRIFGTLWGNEMIFAPKVAIEQSAPGQLTRDQLEVIFKELKG
jgi:3-dehydroquinate dehydratase type I